MLQHKSLNYSYTKLNTIYTKSNKTIVYGMFYAIRPGNGLDLFYCFLAHMDYLRQMSTMTNLKSLR